MRYLVLALGLLPLPALADDRSYLTALLEDNLSGAGRQVVITGFAGALSSRASIDQLTIADDVGVWPTVTTPIVACLTNPRGAALPAPVRMDTSITRHQVQCVIGESSVNHKLTLDKLISTLS